MPDPDRLPVQLIVRRDADPYVVATVAEITLPTINGADIDTDVGTVFDALLDVLPLPDLDELDQLAEESTAPMIGRILVRVLDDHHRALVLDELHPSTHAAAARHAARYGGWAVLAVELELAALLGLFMPAAVRDIEADIPSVTPGVGPDLFTAATRIVDLFRP